MQWLVMEALKDSSESLHADLWLVRNAQAEYKNTSGRSVDEEKAGENPLVMESTNAVELLLGLHGRIRQKIDNETTDEYLLAQYAERTRFALYPSSANSEDDRRMLPSLPDAEALSELDRARKEAAASIDDLAPCVPRLKAVAASAEAKDENVGSSGPVAEVVDEGEDNGSVAKGEGEGEGKEGERKEGAIDPAYCQTQKVSHHCFGPLSLILIIRLTASFSALQDRYSLAVRDIAARRAQDLKDHPVLKLSGQSLRKYRLAVALTIKAEITSAFKDKPDLGLWIASQMYPFDGGHAAAATPLESAVLAVVVRAMLRSLCWP